ncbi:histone-lysine N-methyltransferase SUVR3 isoform X2 [Humulus lupulus]|uniref:histone-lysine N-methyltransferase SUVR3 isoform X2 n=1 Tax=Humulus lupulus TaxID=3486 RepID=UPI002B4018A5|nr:histone-lysine N-methyltransferase SUVR3 isoform X2 [Humulus lupulus]
MTTIREPAQQKRQRQQENDNPNNSSLFFRCADLLLPWLTPTELANASLTCKTLNHIAKSVTARRCSDASRSLEKLPIPCSNSVDDQLYPYFFYTPSQIPPSQFPQRQSWGSISAADPSSTGRFGVEWVSLVDESGGCDCERCGDDGHYRCPCLRFDGLEDLVSECGPSCGCELECGNRLTQREVSVLLKIVKDSKKGWCVCSAQSISKGQFICEYAGELLITNEARKRHQEYDKLASGGGFSSALLVVREHLPSGKACLRLNIDATRMGNVARFINHSCDGGNLSTVLVRSSGSLLPRLTFFASKNIKENEELTFSYGGVRLRRNGSPCFCGSSSCFGWLPSEDT